MNTNSDKKLKDISIYDFLYLLYTNDILKNITLYDILTNKTIKFIDDSFELNIIEFLNIFLQFIDNINNITLHLIFDAINYDNDLIQLIQEKNLNILMIISQEDNNVNDYFINKKFDQILERSFNDILNDHITKDMIIDFLNY